MIGAKLGPYEITGKLGEGGMGEVYRATDTKLKRDVAIKVLPAAFVEDRERLARFEREAQLLAQLHHPNIASIFGLEESDGMKALVMELVEGPTLAERLEQGALPLDESLSLARQIAEALEEAHEKGIIHRDLKPQNIKASIEGKVKVLDFGLAKAMDPMGAASGGASVSQLAASPTLTLGATVQGMILGTAAYMAPEQAKGFTVDKRADIWAFGVVLYEMLTGTRLFEAPTVPETLAQVLTRTPDLDALPASTPPAIRGLLGRCFERQPKRRLRDIGEARVLLDAVAAGEADAAPGIVATPAAPARRAVLLGVLGGVALGVLVTLGALLVGHGSSTAAAAPERAVKFRIELPEGQHLGRAKISPDGRSIAWDTGDTLWVRRLDQLEPRRIDLPWRGLLEAWTRDSRELVVVRLQNGSAGDLWRVPATGGDPQPIGSLPNQGFLWSVTAGPDGKLVLGMANAGLFTMQVAGGPPQPLLPAAKDESFGGPAWLPGGRALLFADVDRGRIEALVGGKRKVILERKGERYLDPLYSPTGHLIVRVKGGRSAAGIWAVPFSLDRLATTGDPFRVLPYGTASISDDGTLVVGERQGDRSTEHLVEVGRMGEVLKAIGDSLIEMRFPALSPEGGRVAVSARRGSDADSDLFVIDRSNGARYRLRDDLGNEYFPAWSRDGKEILFATFNAGIRYARARAADGSGAVRQLDDKAMYVLESPDGKYLVTSYFKTHYRERGSEEWHQMFDGISLNPDFTPDGRWLAYSTNFGWAGISLRRFPSGDGLTPVTSEAASDPHFGGDGKELYFVQKGALVSVPVDLAGETAKVGSPRVLFDLASAHLDPQGGFDVTPEGTFLMVQRIEKEDASKPRPDDILVARNWFQDFSTAAGGAGGQRP